MNLELLSQLQERIQQIEQIPVDHYSDQDEAFRQMLAHAAAVAGEDSPEYGLALRSQASASRNRGELSRAVAEYAHALSLIESGGDSLFRQLIETCITLSGLYAQLRNIGNAETFAKHAVQLIVQYAGDPGRYAQPDQDPTEKLEPAATAGLTAAFAQKLVKALAVSSTGKDSGYAVDFGLCILDDLQTKLSQDFLCLFHLFLVRGSFEHEHGKSSLETFQHLWSLAHLDGDVDSRIDVNDWVNLGYIALWSEQIYEALECVRLIKSLQRNYDEEQLADSYKALKLEAAIYLAGQDSGSAEQALRRLRDFSLATFGKESDEFLDAETKLGNFLIDDDRPEEALNGLQYVASVRTAAENLYDARIAESLFDLAYCLDKSNQDIEALEYYAAAYDRYLFLFGPHHAKTLQASSNLAETARVAHDYETAERWFRIALDGYLQAGNRRSAGAALVMNNLAETILATKSSTEAAALADEALATRAELFGVGSRQYKRSESVVLQAELALGDIEKVEARLDSFRSTSPSGKLEIAADHVAAYYELKGDFEQAIYYCKKALEQAAMPARKGDMPLLPGQDRHYQFRLGSLYAKTGNWKDAREYFFKALQAEIVFISDECAHRSRRQVGLLLRESRGRIKELLTVLCSDPETTQAHLKTAYEVLQQRRGIETRLLRMQKPSFVANPALTTIDPESDWLEKAKADMEGLVEQLRVARRNWIWELIQEAQYQGSNPDGPSLLRLQDKVEYFERELAGYVGQGARDMELFGVTATTPPVPAGTAIVEYYLADDITPVYYAFVVKQDDFVQLRQIGDAASMHQAIQQLRIQIIEGAPEPDNPNLRWKRRAKYLSNRLLQPLADLLEDCERLYIVPDAELFTLPFDLLPIDEEHLAIDRWTISHLWNGGELGAFNMILGSPVLPSDPVVISAPAMGETKPEDWKFATLPFAEEEGKSIAEMTKGLSLPDTEATKATFLEHENAEILHLATHSFYIPRQIIDSQTSLRAVPDTLLYRARAALADPMERSGVALAGANSELNAPTESSEGILFASEVLDLDLRGTDLTVLSSCQSGLGDSDPGDGIQGLRRAFRAAGSKTVVSSLWKVPDEATRDFMVEFYRRILAQTPRGKALRESKLALRNRYKDDPLVWAAFVLDGFDRPLARFNSINSLKFANITGIGLTYDAALEHIEKQQWEKAIFALETVIQSRTANKRLRAKARYMRGYALRNAGRIEDARDAYSEVILNIDTPQDVQRDAIMGRAICSQLLGDLNQAYLDYTALIEAYDPQDEKRASVLINRAAVLIAQSMWEKAIDDCNEVLSNPASPMVQKFKALINRADSHRLQGDCAAAITDADTLIEMKEANGTGEQARAYLSRSLCYLHDKQLDKAIQDIRFHLKFRPYKRPQGILKQVKQCEILLARKEYKRLPSAIRTCIKQLL